MYKSVTTRTIASKGLKPQTFELKEGEAAPDMDGATLKHALEMGWVQKVSVAVKQAPETKAPAAKKAVRKSRKKTPTE